MFHYSNDTFASSDGIDWDRLAQSVNSTQSQPGRHFIIIEGHRLYESEAIMKLPHQVVFLTGTHYTLRNRKTPTPEASFKLYCDRIRPLLSEINDSKKHPQTRCSKFPRIDGEKGRSFPRHVQPGLPALWQKDERHQGPFGTLGEQLSASTQQGMDSMNMSLTLFVHYWHRWMLCEAVHPKFDFDVRSAIKVFFPSYFRRFGFCCGSFISIESRDLLLFM